MKEGNLGILGNSKRYITEAVYIDGVEEDMFELGFIKSWIF